MSAVVFVWVTSAAADNTPTPNQASASMTLSVTVNTPINARVLQPRTADRPAQSEPRVCLEGGDYSYRLYSLNRAGEHPLTITTTAPNPIKSDTDGACMLTADWVRQQIEHSDHAIVRLIISPE
ncbi:MAG: hypothetical protein AAF465_04520 [Pseudomonadota bacterium]